MFSLKSAIESNRARWYKASATIIHFALLIFIFGAMLNGNISSDHAFEDRVYNELTILAMLMLFFFLMYKHKISELEAKILKLQENNKAESS